MFVVDETNFLAILDEPTPENPNHICGSDNVICDGICVDYYSHFYRQRKAMEVYEKWKLGGSYPLPKQITQFD